MIAYQDDLRGIWEILDRWYSASSTFRKRAVHLFLVRTRYIGQAMQDYIAKRELMSALFASMDALVDERLVLIMFVERLGDSSLSLFGTANFALQTKEDPICEPVIARLLHESVLQQVLKPETISTKVLALVSRTQKIYERNNNNKNTYGSGEGCWYCGKPGHIKAECFKKRQYWAKNDNGKDTHDKTMVALVRSDTSRKERALVARHKTLVDSEATAQMVKTASMITGNSVSSDSIFGTADKDIIKSKPK